MPRETVEQKALRYVAERRLHVHRVDAASVHASCHGGNGARYHLGWDGRRWSCSCPARGRCCHLAALWLVTCARPERMVTSKVDTSGAAI